MAEDIKKDKDEDVIENEDLVKEIADIDSAHDDTPFDTADASTKDKDEDEVDSKTVKDGDKDEDKDEKTVKGDEEPTKDDKEVSDGEETEKKDKIVDKKEKDEEISSEEKSEKDPDKDKDEKDVSQIDRLLTEIDRLSGLVKPEVSEVKPSDDKKEEDKKDKKVVEVEESIYDFVKGLDMDDVASDPTVFNKILHKVIARVQRQTAEQVLLSIPKVVMSQVQQQTYFKRMADDFYKDNPDLVNVRQVVRACAQQVQKDNPEWEIEKVFSEAAVRTRKTLGITAQKIKTKEEEDDVTSVEDVAFAKASGGSKSNLKRQKSSLQSEIDEL